jgi:hypothetical protein
MVPFGLILGYGILAGGNNNSAATSEKTTNAADAAQIGDTVTIRYPNLTVMCERKDMGIVYIAGEIALRQTMRVENSALKAVQAEREAQKHAMATAYSCEWAPKKETRFVVQEKQIVGDEQSLFHVAEYCLRPETSDKCLWIEDTATGNSQIDRVAVQQGNK